MEFVIKKGEKRDFKQKAYYETQYDMQDSFTIRIFRGERLFVKDNVELGSFTLSNLSKCKKGNIIIIEFDYNIKNNTLEVIAYEKSNRGNEQRLQRQPYSVPFNDMEVILIKEPQKFKENDDKRLRVFFEIENLRIEIAGFEEIITNYEYEQPVLIKLIRDFLNDIKNHIDYKNYDIYYNKFEECKLIIEDLNNANVNFKTQNEMKTKVKILEMEKKELTDRVRILQNTIKEYKSK